MIPEIFNTQYMKTLDKENSYDLVGLCPNDKLCLKHKTSGITVMFDSNVFIDLEVGFDSENSVLHIHVAGKPPVKKIIYG